MNACKWGNDWAESEGGEEDADLWEEMKVGADERLWGTVTMETLVEKKRRWAMTMGVPCSPRLMTVWSCWCEEVTGRMKTKERVKNNHMWPRCPPPSVLLIFFISFFQFQPELTLTASYLPVLPTTKKSKADRTERAQLSKPWLLLECRAHTLNIHRGWIQWDAALWGRLGVCFFTAGCQWLHECEHIWVCVCVLLWHCDLRAVAELISYSLFHIFDM